MELAEVGDPKGLVIYALGGGDRYHHLWKAADKGQQDAWRAVIIAAATRKAADGAAKSLDVRRDRADAWTLALCAKLEEVTQHKDFDALSWVTDLVSKTAALSGPACGTVTAAAGVLRQLDYNKVTTNFGKSPLALKKSKPSEHYRRKHPDALAAWHERVRESKLVFISGTPFPSQTGAVVPDPRGAEKRLKTFLYYYYKEQSRRGDKPEDDPQEHEEQDDDD
jgi:hypothetical protein